MARIDTLDALLALYDSPTERVRTKKRSRLDDGLRAVLATSPFVLLATADADGRCDVSPRGGPPGFVKALDDRHVAIPDLNGNNLVDSLRNLVANPHAGLLVVIPGQNETLRIDGPAHLTTDAGVLDRFTDELRRPKLAIVVEVASVFTHCAKSFRRGRLWEPTTWPITERSLALEARYRQLELDVPFEAYADDNESKIAGGLALDQPA
jgi:PPOX class probable FMN-dependent enzyme